MIAVARTSHTMMNRSGDSGHSCFVFDLKENPFSFLSLSMLLVVGLSHIAFIMLKCVPSIPPLLRIFTRKGC